MMSLPYVGPALAARGFGGAAFEAIPFTFRISFRWGLLVEHKAQVDEMLLRRRAFLEFGRLPFTDKLFRCHSGSNSDDLVYALSRFRFIRRARKGQGLIFSGSGSTGMGCAQEGMKLIGIELARIIHGVV